MRLFIAIELPDPVRLKLAGLCRQWKENWGDDLLGLGRDYPKPSWVGPENLHVTVKFLGEVGNSEVPKLCDTLCTVPSGRPMTLWPDRIECLPPNGPVRVICAGLMGDLDRFSDLYREIEQRCETIGFPAERRRFRPHITLARLRDWRPAYTRKALVDASAGALPAREFNASEFVLTQSLLHQSGTQYVPLARFPLQSSRS